MEGSLTGGSITIDNAVVGQTYSAYQILYLESYNATAGAYSYKANSAWETWLKTQTTYVSFDAQGYVTWVKDANAAAFAKAAQVEAAKMTANATATATTTEVKFENLKLGYYLVDTTLGTICSLDTTNPSVTIKEKNTAPTINKQVKEDSTSNWEADNDAQIGDTIYFKTTISAKAGAQNYVVHDWMTEGLTLNKESIQIVVGESPLTKGTDYTVVFENDKDKDENVIIKDICDFEITFASTYLDTIKSETEIVITYNATLNASAAIYGNKNTNTTKMTYGEGNQFQTASKQTETYTYKFDLVKTKSGDEVLSGAEFKLYDAQTDGNQIILVKEADGSYRVAVTDAEKTANADAVIEAGNVTIKGLDFDSKTVYWLEETKAPEGYNKIDGRIPVNQEKVEKEGESGVYETKIITGKNMTATVTDNKWISGGVHVINKTGTELPSTGGIGTTVFYAAGVILALGAAVALVARRRMRTE